MLYLPEETEIAIRTSAGRLLLVGTGALLSPTTVQQGETIPGIAHGVLIEYRQEG